MQSLRPFLLSNSNKKENKIFLGEKFFLASAKKTILEEPGDFVIYRLFVSVLSAAF
jgi:hypothetical protein